MVIQVYITSARRAYRLADHYRREGRLRGPRGSARDLACRPRRRAHADSIFLGPGEDIWPRVPGRLSRRASRSPSTGRRCGPSRPCPRCGATSSSATSTSCPTRSWSPAGCPHTCDFCYKEAFFAGGKGFYTQRVDAALAEIERLPGRHLYFLDDHLFGDVRFADALFEGMRGLAPRLAGRGDGELRPEAGAPGEGGGRRACAASSSASRP